MTETAATAEIVAKPRCRADTKSGPCVRPEGHTPNGHMSQKILDAKTANAKAKKSGDPEVIAAREAEKTEKKIAALRAMAESLGFKVTPVTEAAKAAVANEDASASA